MAALRERDGRSLRQRVADLFAAAAARLRGTRDAGHRPVASFEDEDERAAREEYLERLERGQERPDDPPYESGGMRGCDCVACLLRRHPWVRCPMLVRDVSENSLRRRWRAFDERSP